MPQQRGSARRVSGYSPPKFSADDPALLEYLDTYGYAVVEAVADPAQISRAHDDFWAFHEGIGTRDGASQILRSDPGTWGADFLAHPATGIITGYGFGQSRFCWNLRTLPDVPRVFEAIWGTDDLVTSFDGGAAFRPWSAADAEWKTQGGWWHCDQNATRPGRSGKVCVQGLVQLTPAHEYTGGERSRDRPTTLPRASTRVASRAHAWLTRFERARARRVRVCVCLSLSGFCVIPGSHKGHEAFSRRHPSAAVQGDFLIVPDEDPLLTEATGFHMIRAAPGDLILWDSRTIHCNGPAIHPPESAPADVHMPRLPNELLRLVGYVCCTPSAWVAKAVAHKRAQAAIEKTTSTHWPHAFIPTVSARAAHEPPCPARLGEGEEFMRCQRERSARARTELSVAACLLRATGLRGRCHAYHPSTPSWRHGSSSGARGRGRSSTCRSRARR